MGNLAYPSFGISRQDDITQRQVKFYTDIIEIYNLYSNILVFVIMIIATDYMD